MIRSFVGAAMRLTLGRILPKLRLNMTTVNVEAFVDIPLACLVMSPAVITLALVLFLGVYNGTFVLSAFAGLSSPVFILARPLVVLFVNSILGSRLVNP